MALSEEQREKLKELELKRAEKLLQERKLLPHQYRLLLSVWEVWELRL